MNRVTVTAVRQEKDEITGDWLDAAEEFTLLDCTLAPTSTVEQSPRNQFGQQVTSRWDVFWQGEQSQPAGYTVRSTDRFRLPGEAGSPRWQVAGDPSPWESPWSQWRPGTVITIERTTG